MTARYAHVFDGPGPTGEPTISADHSRLTPELAEQLGGYLRGGTCVLRTSGLKPDKVDPTRQVGQSLFTDGQWFWHEELVRYVEEYHLAPSEDFVVHCEKLTFITREPSADEIQALLGQIGVRPAGAAANSQ